MTAAGTTTAASATTATQPMLVVDNVFRTYGAGEAAVHALAGVSLHAAPGELVAVVGRSGSGKTSLLNIIAGLDRPDAGRVTIDGTDVSDLDNDGLDDLRRDTVSVIFQSFGLLEELSAAENVGLPLRLTRTDPQARERRAELMLELVGLASHTQHRPDELSGGQMQRVAIARALAVSPRLLVADEPTGQLDTDSGLAVMALIRGVVESENMAAAVSTPDPVMIALADRVIHIDDGRLRDA